jgi:hypothetical protein
MTLYLEKWKEDSSDFTFDTATVFMKTLLENDILHPSNEVSIILRVQDYIY